MAPVEPVGHNSADQREQEDRNLAEKRIESQHFRVLRHFENQPALRLRLHPRADRRRARADPHQPEFGILEGFEGSIEQGPASRLRQRLRALDQVYDVAIAVGEKH